MSKPIILVVEDDFSTKDLIVQVISEDFPDYDILSADNGQEGLDLMMANDNVTICITDGRMPLMDGFVFVSNVRKKFPDVAIVFLTACSTEFKKADAFCLGVDEYIEKPFDIDSLSIAVGKAVEKHQNKSDEPTDDEKEE
jgi:DNA-binding response OmpR family regulator